MKRIAFHDKLIGFLLDSVDSNVFNCSLSCKPLILNPQFKLIESDSNCVFFKNKYYKKSLIKLSKVLKYRWNEDVQEFSQPTSRQINIRINQTWSRNPHKYCFLSEQKVVHLFVLTELRFHWGKKHASYSDFYRSCHWKCEAKFAKLLTVTEAQPKASQQTIKPQYFLHLK